MLVGREFQLQIATVAVDALRVAVKLPAGSVIKVISDASDGLMNVVSDNQPFTMFAVDITERGREIWEPSEQLTLLDHERIRKVLQSDVEAAQERRTKASERFTEVMADIPSGLPPSDGTDRIRIASREYSNSLVASTLAATRLNEFLIRGTIPPELERKDMGKELRDNSDTKKASA